MKKEIDDVLTGWICSKSDLSEAKIKRHESNPNRIERVFHDDALAQSEVLQAVEGTQLSGLEHLLSALEQLKNQAPSLSYRAHDEKGYLRKYFSAIEEFIKELSDKFK